MSIMKPGRKKQPEMRRAAILKAARCVFARQGYADTVVDDIASQAGIAKGTLYLYFRSKEEVFYAALIEDAREMQALTRERMDSAESWQEKLRAYVSVRMEYLETREDYLRIYLGEIRSMMVRGLRMQCDLFHVLRESENHLAQMFAAAVAKGEIRPVSPDLAALTVTELTRGLMERRLLGWSPDTAVVDVEFALDLVCRSLTNREPCPVDSSIPRRGA